METINFTRGVPANESFPTTDLIDAASAVFKTHGTAMLQYGPSRGFEPLRQWLAEWQGVPVDRVMTSNGSLQLIEFLCLQMLKPGDLVFTESPSYDRTINLLRRHGAKVVGIPLEADGPNIEALERALQKAVPKFFYVIPDFQNPAGATCSGEKRRQLAALADRYNFLLVEDAPYRLLRYRGKEEPTLYSLAPQRTLHMSSFTKITYEWCRRGLLPPQIEKLKALYAPRLDATLSGLDKYMPDATATRPDGGFFISLTLPEGVSTTAVRQQASTRALNLADGLAFFPDGGGERFVRLPFCALSPTEIDEGLKRLAESVGAARTAHVS